MCRNPLGWALISEKFLRWDNRTSVLLQVDAWRQQHQEKQVSGENKTTHLQVSGRSLAAESDLIIKGIKIFCEVVDSLHCSY